MECGYSALNGVFVFFFADSTAAIILKMGPFSLDDPKDYSVDVHVSDGGRPIQTSVTKLAIEVCCVGSRKLTTHGISSSSEGLNVHKKSSLVSLVHLF